MAPPTLSGCPFVGYLIVTLGFALALYWLRLANPALLTKQLCVSQFDPHTNAFANHLTADAIISYLDAHPAHLEIRALVPVP